MGHSQRIILDSGKSKLGKLCNLFPQYDIALRTHHLLPRNSDALLFLSITFVFLLKKVVQQVLMLTQLMVLLKISSCGQVSFVTLYILYNYFRCLNLINIE